MYDRTYHTKAQNCKATNIITRIVILMTNIDTKVITIEPTKSILAIILPGLVIFLNCLVGPIKKKVLIVYL